MTNNTPLDRNVPYSVPINQSKANFRNNFAEILKTLQGIIENDFVITGFDIASSSGLDITINPGEAIISGYRVEKDTQTTLTMSDDATSYIYYQITIDANDVVTSQGFVVNTTGVQPSNSVPIAEVVTATGAVSSQSDKRQMGFKVNSADNADTVDGKHYLDILQAVYPVGSIYINASVSTDPATLLGFGTWEQFGQGRVLVGQDSTQPEFDTLGETGGEKTHTLTIDEMPAHTHGYFNHENGSCNYYMEQNYSAGTETNQTTDPTGGGLPHNNLQPYIVVYMWKRIA